MRLLACLIVAPQRGYDEPAILAYAISSFCPTSADGLHLASLQRCCRVALGRAGSLDASLAAGLQPNAPVVQATVPEILKQAYATEPGTQKEIIIDHGDGLCSKVMIEPSTDEALNAFIDPDAAKNFAVPLR